MNIAILPDEIAENFLNNTDFNNAKLISAVCCNTDFCSKDLNNKDIEAILDIALKERDAIISQSSLLEELQKEIDSTMSDFNDLSSRLESLAFTARDFNIKKGFPSRLAQLESNIVFL